MAEPVLAVTSATDTDGAVDDDVKNPAVAPGANGRQTVHVTLHFQGVTYTPNDIYDMVNAQYGTVASPKSAEAQAHGIFIFSVSA